jgi:hypothetical protein
MWFSQPDVSRAAPCAPLRPDGRLTIPSLSRIFSRMAKLLPFRRRIVRGIASCGVVLAVLLQALTSLVAASPDRAPPGDLAVSAAATQLCRAVAGGGHPPNGERHSCDLCALCESDRQAAKIAFAPAPSGTIAPPRLAAALLLAPGADAPPPPARRTSSWSSRAPPRA